MSRVCGPSEGNFGQQEQLWAGGRYHSVIEIVKRLQIYSSMRIRCALSVAVGRMANAASKGRAVCETS